MSTDDTMERDVFVPALQLRSGAQIASADAFEGGTTSPAFPPDGQRLASGSQGSEAMKLWDVPTRQEVVILAGEGLISGGLRFSPDSRLLVGINSWGKVHIWRAPSLDEIEHGLQPDDEAIKTYPPVTVRRSRT